MKSTHMIYILVLTLLAGLIAGPVWAAPALPSDFYGRVMRDGAGVPDGTEVTAWVNGIRCGQAATLTWNGDSVYSLNCIGDDLETAPVEGGREGDTVTFQIGGQNAGQTGTWHSGSSAGLDLTLSSVTPRVLSVAPNSGRKGAAIVLNVVGEGTHFVSPIGNPPSGTTQLTLGNGITVTSVVVTDATHLRAELFVQGDALAGPRDLVLTTGAEVVTSTAAFTVMNEGIRVTPVKDATGVPGALVDLPVLLLDPLPAQTGYAYEFTLGFDPTVLHFQQAIKAGTLSENFLVVATAGEGQVRLAAYGTTPLTGTGELVKLRFNVIGMPGSGTDLSLSGFTFDEGEPQAVVESGHFTVNRSLVQLGGKFFYYRSLRPISGGLCTLSGSTTLTATTSVTGTYLLDIDRMGDYTVTPTMVGGVGNALSALDAAWITQYAAGQRNFGNDQLLACDVSGNGSCTGLDASLIARYLIGDAIAFPVGSWKFDPVLRSYAQFDGVLLHEDYMAYLLGDVTYNWGSSTYRRQVSKGKGGVEINLPEVRSGGRARMTIPLQVTSLTGLEVLGYEVMVIFDPTVLRFESLDSAASLSSGWQVVENHATPGRIKLVGYGLSALEGAGVLVNLNFVVVGQAGQSSILGLQQVQLNEGNPSVAVTVGRITLDAGYKVFLPVIVK